MKTRQQIEEKIAEVESEIRHAALYGKANHGVKCFDHGICWALGWVLSEEYGMSEKLDLEEINNRNVHKVIIK